MKAGNRVGRWAPYAGVLAVGVLAFGLSFELQGATPLGGEKGADSQIELAAPTNWNPTVGSFQVVDYRDDEGTRLREAGLLIGPLPLPDYSGMVAAIGCTFDADCITDNPCTIDTCNIAPGAAPGSGTCQYEPVPEGLGGGCGDDSVCNGFPTCENLVCDANSANPGADCTASVDCQGGGSHPDGICYGACVENPQPATCCNEEGKRTVCTDFFGACDDDSINVGEPCTRDLDCREGKCERCRPHCADTFCSNDHNTACPENSCVAIAGVCSTSPDLCEVDEDCPRAGVCGGVGTCLTPDEICQDVVDNGDLCNGFETCNETTGECEAGLNPCGFNAKCDWKKCSGGENNGIICATDQTCPGGRCLSTDDGDPETDDFICKKGRCCIYPGEGRPACTLQKVDECVDDVSGDLEYFYASDEGFHDTGQDAQKCGNQNPLSDELDPYGCPQYSSGFGQHGPDAPPDYRLFIGPISDGPLAIDLGSYSGPINKIGDDYAFEATGTYLGLDALRWYGGVLTLADRVIFEFYDNADPPNFIEDIIMDPISGTEMGVHVVAFDPALIIPSEGFVVVRVASAFEPNTQIAWASTVGPPDEGTNDDTVLWLNDGPVANFLPDSEPGIMAFELVGDTEGEPVGACCDYLVTGCTQELQWICAAGGSAFFDGDACNACANSSDNPNGACLTCQGGTSGTCPAGTCVDGPFPGSGCTVDADCRDLCEADADCAAWSGTCLPDDGLCGGAVCSNDDSNDCVDSAECIGIPGVCSTAVVACNFDSECPDDGICGGAGTCLPGTCESPGCDTGACCNPATGECLEGMAQGACEGTCNLGTNVCDSGVNVGAGCAVDADCGVFNGNGTDCDPDCCRQPYDAVGADDPGNDDLYDNDCSDGTCFTGADDCPEAIVHQIPIPAPGADPVVVTISGNNEYASSTEADPDGCWGVVEDPLNDEPGWFERFELMGTDTIGDSDCAWVRIDMCCSDPIHEPQYSILWDDCLCNGGPDAVANPYHFGEAAHFRGEPYCDEDNLWYGFGPLTPREYVIPVFSQLAGAHGDYQFHITVEACPVAACCIPDVCTGDGTCAGPGAEPCLTCQGGTEPGDSACTSQTDCDNNGLGGTCLPNDELCTPSCTAGVTQTECTDYLGFWLGPPQKLGQAVTTCTGDPCAEGSCCVGAGVCKDAGDNFGDPMIRSTCELPPGLGGFGGVFTPGVQCFGERCVNDDRYSCEADPDCAGTPGGPCGTNAELIAQPNPCPICESERADTCQGLSSMTAELCGGTIRISDTSASPAPIRMADNVVPTETAVLESVCTIGEYRGWTVGENCRTTGAGTVVDQFTVRLYGLDTPCYQPTPMPLGEWSTEIAENPDTPLLCANWGENFDFYQVQLTLIPTPENPLVTLQAGETYFLEISNHTTGGDPDCNWWHLVAVAGSGDNILWQDPGQVVNIADAADQDMSICMNVANRAPVAAERACCLGTTCEDRTYLDCVADDGDWQACNLCSDVDFVCPLPRNDDCDRAEFIEEGSTPFSLYNTSLDGPESELCIGDLTETEMAFDIWYNYVPAASGDAVISTCDQEYYGWEVVSVYTDPANPTICPCPEDGGAFQFHSCGFGSNDNYIDPDGCSAWGGQGDLPITVTAGRCYTVRISGSVDGGTDSIAYGEVHIDLFPAYCGNDTREAVLGGEQCDGTDDSLCPGECDGNCLCPPPVCGDDVAVPELGQECDGTDDSFCPGNCRPPGDTEGEPCSCIPVCGNDRKEQGELCDGTDDDLCPGQCVEPGPSNECRCETTCGDGILEIGEECDLGGIGGAEPDDAECPGACDSNCQCPEPECGNGIVEPSNNEECDGTAGLDLGALCESGCRPPGDPAGECECACGAAGTPPPTPEVPPVEPFGSHVDKNRYISMVLPTGVTAAAGETAIRVTLTSLHHPVAPVPHPDFTAWEGNYRWVNSLNETHTCPDSPNFPGTIFRCAVLGCEPEYRAWAEELGGEVLHVTGASVVPSSTYDVAQLDAAGCQGQEASCTAISTELPISTAQFGDVDPLTDGLVVLDIARVVDHVKGKPYPTTWPPAAGTALFKPRVHLRPNLPLALIDNVGVLDIAVTVDAVKGKAYTHFGCFGPCTDACPAEAACEATPGCTP